MINIILASITLWVFAWLFVKMDDLMDNVIEWIARKIFKRVPKERRIFRSTGDIFDDLKNTTLRDRYLRVYRFFLHIAELPSDAYYQIRFWYQRAKRGWANSDAWGFDYYLARVIKEGCQYLKKQKHGCPCLDGFATEESGNYSDETFDLMCKEWDRRLDCIIYTFEMAEIIQEDNFYYQKSIEWTQEKADQYNKIWHNWKYQPPPRALTLEECKKYEEGWTYFREHFFSLWD